MGIWLAPTLGFSNGRGKQGAVNGKRPSYCIWRQIRICCKYMHGSQYWIIKVAMSFQRLPSTKRNIAALSSPVLRGLYSSFQGSWSGGALDVVCGQGPLTPGKRNARIESSHCWCGRLKSNQRKRDLAFCWLWPALILRMILELCSCGLSVPVQLFQVVPYATRCSVLICRRWPGVRLYPLLTSLTVFHKSGRDLLTWNVISTLSAGESGE